MKKYGSCKCQFALLLMFAATGLFAAERPPVETDSRQKEKRAGIGNMDALKRSGKLTNAYLAYSVVDPMGRKSFSYDTPIPEEGMNGKLQIMAAQNDGIELPAESAAELDHAEKLVQ